MRCKQPMADEVVSMFVAAQSVRHIDIERNAWRSPRVIAGR
jgi:hypothetical protein